jgi:hypothetical protein
LVADLRFGELATAETCDYLAAALSDSGLTECLAIQREDERRHAALYRCYLEALAVEARPDPALARIHRRCLDWNGDPVAVVLAMNVVLEGEALRLQRFFAERFPCPLFADMNRAILADEARHVASGRIYAAAALTGLDPDQRATILAWLRELWWECAMAVRARFGGVQGRFISALLPPLSLAWQAQAAALAQLGLPSAEATAHSRSTWPIVTSLS